MKMPFATWRSSARRRQHERRRRGYGYLHERRGSWVRCGRHTPVPYRSSLDLRRAARYVGCRRQGRDESEVAGGFRGIRRPATRSGGTVTIKQAKMTAQDVNRCKEAMDAAVVQLVRAERAQSFELSADRPV